ncbi:hypothetical protein NFI96_023856, partial [Prochilodus magdalenae]
VQYIRRFSKPEQWHYICTTQNPADHATRSVPAAQLTSTTWLTGPHFLSIAAGQPITEEVTYDLIEPNLDPEVRSHATTLTGHPSSTLGSYRFERFSSWKSLVQAIAFLKHVVKSKITVKKDKTCCGWHVCTQPYTAEELLEAETLIITCVQQETYREEFSCIAARKDIPKGNSLRKLNPCVDEDGLLRIGGRLKHGRLEARQKYPLVIPGQSHIATLLVRHFHDKVRHQGRAFTEGAIRTAGFWIVGAKNCIKRILHSCVTCLKLRGRAVEQKMADLPADRLSMEPPFTYVGLDVFGPWTVITRRTQGGQANNKRLRPPPSNDSTDFLNILNTYFSRFKESNSIPIMKAPLSPDDEVLCLDPADVQMALRKVNPQKAAGPDNIPGLADDTTVVELISNDNDSAYREEVNQLIA